MCWVALVPLLMALLGEQPDGRPVGVRQGALLGYGCGFLWYLGNCYWIYQTMYLYGGLPRPIAFGILILFSMYLGLYHAVFAAVLVTLRRSGLGRQGALLAGAVCVGECGAGEGADHGAALGSAGCGAGG